MRVWSVALVASLGVVLCLAEAPCFAQQASDDEARGLFLQGRAAFDGGRFEEALGYFERSFALSGRTALLFNIGLSQERLHRDAEALESLGRYRESLLAAERAAVEERMEAIRARMRAEASIAPTSEGPRERKPVYRTWWFWTIAGVATAGIVTGVVIAASGGGSSDPISGDVGGVVATLR